MKINIAPDDGTPENPHLGEGCDEEDLERMEAEWREQHMDADDDEELPFMQRVAPLFTFSNILKTAVPGQERLRELSVE